jgi:nitroreductase
MTLDLLLTRRSIRKYTDQPVTDDQVRTILRAAMAAPSAGNQRPWEFLVIRDPATREAITTVHPHASMLPSAPVAIFVVGDLTKQLHENYWPVDCAAATQNLLLGAHALGLGAVWLGVHPRPERCAALKRMFALPEPIMPFALVSIGHPAEVKGPAERYEEARVHWDCW